MDASQFCFDAIESLDPGSSAGKRLKADLELALLEAMNKNGKKGVDEAIGLLNHNGHDLRLVASDGELSEYSEKLPDGDRVFVVRACLSSEFSFVHVLFETAEPDDLGPGEEVLEELRRSFYKRFVEIVTNVDADRFAELEPGARDIYVVGLLEGEVNNGGFSQYFWNTEGQHAAVTVDVLKRVGAKETASLLRRAMKLYGAPPSDDLDEWYDRLERVDSEHEDALAELDEHFYEGVDDLPVLVMKHLNSQHDR
ncbi:MAG TPA: DUF4375 domain-containing protein [Gammaproteobacteria bacterium]|nr:DUF4375 domain-containing protein [Gammaproteobacteria bacterium]